MSKFGILELLRLRVKYSPTEGSSRGARDFVGNLLHGFRKESPQLEVIVEEAKGHPSLKGEYRNGRHREMEIKNTEGRKVLEKAQLLRDSKFREDWITVGRHMAKTRSLQGRWTTQTSKQT